MAYAIMIHPHTGTAATVRRSINNRNEVRQPFDGAVIERPNDFEQWSCDSQTEADAMADMARKACPMACVSVVVA